MNRRTGSLVAAILMFASMPAAAQWLNVPTIGIPRTKDGKPDLSAPAPRKPDGKPDLSDIWQMDRNSAERYGSNRLADFKPGEIPIQPWAEAIARERIYGAGASEYASANCLPPGIPILNDSSIGYPLKIIQEPDLSGDPIRGHVGIPADLPGRPNVAQGPQSYLAGYSVGRWDGDVLVVDSTGFNGKTWIDVASGHPSTDALHITERFRRRDYGHLDLQLTIDDPKAYTKPWTVKETLHIAPDNELIEFVCNENEKDLNHLVGK